ncbi:Nucleotide-binding universal stress protein, UspA family [Flavobacterium segetis]|uniref:Nucleotide-binding universal stress protein, UspA family n=2 Tax=Flavobacterium segetis TaxID=271157 RepID=A0A1M5GM13_9FLAO|nr:Nucleotide-binding universal stress protein, UspA family [Flavobacterium segetis]
MSKIASRFSYTTDNDYKIAIMKNILVATDLTEMDEKVINYAKFLKNKWNLDTINFVHNIRLYDIDDTLKDLLGTKDIKSIIHRNLNAKISKIFQEDENYTLEILENANTEYALKNWAERNNVSTILLGFKQKDNGTAAMSQKLIRIFKGDVLLVPANAALSWDRILVPTDLSAMFRTIHAKMEVLKRINPPVNFRIVKSFNIPTVFFPYIDIEDQKVIKEAEKHINKQFIDAKKKYKISDDDVFVAVFRGKNSIVEIIKKESKAFNADLILMSAKGDSSVSSILIGSTINELINSAPFKAIYILKEK